MSARPQTIRAGALVRGNVRLLLAERGCRYTETKTWSESVFVLHCDPAEYVAICRHLS